MELAVQYIENAGSLKALRLNRPPGTFLGGNRRTRRKLEIPRVKSMMNPKIRIVHGKLNCVWISVSLVGNRVSYPTIPIKFRAAIGKTVPPIDAPVAVMPKAVPRLFLNQCPITLRVGPKHIPHAI